MKKLRFYTVLLIVVFSSCRSFASSSTKVAIVFSSDIEPYREISRGFKEILHEKKVSLKSTVYDVSKQEAARILQSIFRDDPELVFTVGPQASILARKKIKNIPVVFSGVLNYKKINFMAYYDALTLLPNRALFNDRLLQELAHAHRNKQKLGIMFIDLDRFKVVNDTLGHTAGDQLLTLVANMLKGCLREGDTVSRQGGDEFALIITEFTDIRSMQEVAAKIIKSFTRPVEVNGREFYVGVSIGISLYPDDGSVPETLVKNADIAMYRAKEKGGSRYCFYSPAMHEKVSKQHMTETLLRRALEKEQFDVYYQPQVNIHTGRMVGMEALIRWRQAGDVKVSTSEFIETAERTRLIAPLDAWVLSTVCKQNMAWQNAGIKPVCMAVNISGHTFQNENIVKMVCAVLKETGMSPQFLELEITEGVAMSNIENTLQKLIELNKLGIKIAIDDFGTGFSSLSYLTKFPIHKIKIGGTFMCSLTDDFTHDEIVTAIVAIAKSLKLKVLAEAVETGKQLQFLKELGCDELQGYLFSKAVAAREMEDMLRQDRCL